MNATTRSFHYPSDLYKAWLADFWAIYQALSEDTIRQDDELGRDVIAVVAALLVVTNKIDDLRD